MLAVTLIRECVKEADCGVAPLSFDSFGIARCHAITGMDMDMDMDKFDFEADGILRRTSSDT